MVSKRVQKWVPGDKSRLFHIVWSGGSECLKFALWSSNRSPELSKQTWRDPKWCHKAQGTQRRRQNRSMPSNQASDTKIDPKSHIRVRYEKRELPEYRLGMPSTVLFCCMGWYLINYNRIGRLRCGFLAKNHENPREQWSSPHFLNDENQAHLIRMHPITPIFTQYITKVLVDLGYTGIYEILSELGGVGCTNPYQLADTN